MNDRGVRKKMDITNVISQGMDVLNHYPGPIMIAASLTASGVVAYFVTRWMEKQTPDADMKRRAILDQIYADKFGDVLFDLLFTDEIDRHEYKRACRRFGIAYRLGDLLVKKNPKRGMAKRIAHNCEVSHRTPHIGRNAGPKPGSDRPISVVVVKRKVWLAKGKVLLHRKSA